jgi:hypothetical protein
MVCQSVAHLSPVGDVAMIALSRVDPSASEPIKGTLSPLTQGCPVGVALQFSVLVRPGQSDDITHPIERMTLGVTATR